MYQCHILNHLHLSQVILTVLQLGFTETFEHIDPLLTLYIVLLCVSRCADEGLGTQNHQLVFYIEILCVPRFQSGFN